MFWRHRSGQVSTLLPVPERFCSGRTQHGNAPVVLQQKKRQGLSNASYSLSDEILSQNINDALPKESLCIAYGQKRIKRTKTDKSPEYPVIRNRL